MFALVGRHRAPLLALVALTAGLRESAVAHAQDGTQVVYDDHSNQALLPVRLDAHASVTWDGYFGFGARVDLPILKKGLSYSTRDELAISFGADANFLAVGHDNPLQVWPTVAVQWSLGVTERFAFYPELGLTAKITHDGWEGIFPNIGFGGRYYVWRSIAVSARFGWPQAITLGATF